MIYTTITDYINENILPALAPFAEGGEFAGEINLDEVAENIAHDMTTWHTEHDANGNIITNRSGLIERDDADFWTLVEKYTA